MKYYWMLTALLFMSYTGIAQKNGAARIDSLQQALATAKQDTSRVSLYYELSLEYIKTDPAKARQYVDTGMQLGKKINWEKGIAYLHIAEGNILNDGGKGNEAIAVYQQAYDIGKESADARLMANALNDLGGVYYQQSDFVNATAYYTKALKLAEGTGDDNMIATCYSNLSTVNYNQQNYSKAIEYGEVALAHYKKLNAPDKIARTLNYIGNVYFGKGDTQKTETYYNQALHLYEQTGNKTGMAILYSQIAILYDPDYAKIISYQEKSQAIWDSINPGHYNSIINLGNMGESYLNIIRADSLHQLRAGRKTELLNKAGEYLNRAIGYSKTANDKDNLGYFSGILAEQQELKGNYKQAIANLKLHYNLQDSLYSQENKNKIASLGSQREIDLRDKEIQLNKLALSAQKKQRIALVTGIGLLLIIGGLLYYQGLMRKRTNTTLLQLNNELDEANKVKARFFAILSHDLRSPIANLVSFLQVKEEAPGLLSPEEAAKHQKKITNAAGTLLENMESMLLWSKGQMETFQPEMRSIAVSDLFTYIRDFFGTTTGVALQFADPGSIKVNTDENYLRTIMHNLTANAIKALQHTPDARIDWKVEQTSEHTLLSITDNGPGMDEQQTKALYDDSVAANSKTGFGLHLIRDLAKAIRCKISIQSKPGAGTTFTLSA